MDSKQAEKLGSRVAELEKELALKNREIEIEGALEKVRAVALAMKKAGELIGVCEAMYHELIALGFSNIRNAQIAINNEVKKTYLAFEYADYGVNIKEQPYDTHKLLIEIEAEVKRSKEALFRKEISGKQLQDWRKWRKDIGLLTDKRLQEADAMCFYIYSIGTAMIGISTYNAISEDQLDILKRFKNVFELCYRRYADVAQAEAQVKEARIETALERVRSRSMGMQKSDELKEVIQIVYEQFIHLNILIEHTGFIMDYKERDDMHIWLADKNEVPAEITIPYFDSPHWNSFIEAKENGLDFFANQLNFEEKNKFYHQLFKLFPGTPVPDETKQYYFNCPGLAISTVLLDSVGLYIENFSGTPYTDDENATLMRFGRVFQQTYTRFSDLQKAEAQAREGQIEASLERVRSKTMAMYNSKDIGDTVATMFDELVKLGVEKSVRCGVGIIIDDTKHLELWTATNTDGNFGLIIGRVDMTMHPMLEGTLTAWKNKEPFYTYLLEGSDRDNYFNALIASPEYRTPYTLETIPERQVNSVFFFPEGCLFAFTTEPMSAEMMQLFKRFTAVFGLTYRRYTDLQKAEAQARESQIQLALERVRARTMAMQKSDELHEVIQLVFDQLHQLNFNVDVANFVLNYKKTDDFDLWLAVAGRRYPTKMYIPYFDHPMFKRFNNAKLHGGLFTDASSYEEKNSFFEHFFKYAGEIPEERKAQIFDSPGYRRSAALMKNVALTIGNYGTIPYSEAENAMLMRFGTVFEHSYTRFLDLKQAEAQAKESQIQLALERVRSRTMAMHHSDELSETVFILFQQFKELGENPDQATIGIINEEEWVIEYWVTMHGSQESRVFKFSIDEPDVTRKIYNGWKEQKKSLVIDLTGKALKDFSSYRALKGGAQYNEAEKQRVINVAFFSKGLINVQSTSARSEESVKLLERFGAVFDGTYTRFLDLKKAEAQAREAQIAAGLERVRSRTLAMQSSDELAATAAVVFKQLIALGIEPNRLFIGIINDDNNGDVELWATDEDGSKVSSSFTGNVYRNGSVKKMYDGWKQKKLHITIDMHGKELKDYFHYLTEELKVPFKLGIDQKRRVQTVAYFSKGFIGIASPDEQPGETIKLLERFADAFNLTFVRFNDLQLAEAHAIQAERDLILLQTEKKRAEDALIELRTTQTQLVQKEKMASLGELTAGIAHEIQNPLNFVNNFSEVNQEMLEELKAESIKPRAERDDQLEIDLINDLIQNEQKINHHGKRADSIVKGMLQHSRTSSGEKASVNINALADEFFKLSYHGLRAKDKNFNAEMVTNFDETLPKIEVAQQDIGRVLLNLFNNAFYAVNEKKKTASKDYRPEVSITSKSENENVSIRVRDNGNGIPDAIKDKIMQPFFTTKPTGEGTGLGLSLSYDIVVKGHRGTISVDTKEGEYTEFTIQLPNKA